MANKIDLQIQSTASDGRHTPREIVQFAHDREIGVIAITDHDTVSGVEEAVRAGEELGVRVISGIEMSAEEHDIHILGFGINAHNEALFKKLEELRQSRVDGAKQMMENLVRSGFVVEWEDVLLEASGPTVARPHIVRAIMKRPENTEMLKDIKTMHDFFKVHLGNDSPNYVRRSHISAEDAIAHINGAGGVAVWSHPIIPEFSGGQYGALEKFLPDLIEWGIEGLEVFNPSHTEDDMEFLMGLTRKYNLIYTAGSDFHEVQDLPEGHTGLHSARFLGDYETYGFSTDDIIEKLDEAMKKH